MITQIINGKTDGQLSLADRALHYGDGVFETIAISGAEPLLFDEHYLRLLEGCERLMFSAPEKSVLRKEAESLARSVDRGVLKIIISRGNGGRGYQPVTKDGPTRILIRYEYPPYPQARWSQGVKLKVCKTILSRNPALAGIKHLNRLEQILARAEWQDDELADGLMLDEKGHVIEGTMTNLFIVENNRLCTPDLSHCGVKGIMRQKVMELALQNGLQYMEENLPLYRLFSADEVFVTNSVIGLWPVMRIDEQDFRPAEVTLRLMDAINKASPPICV